MFSEDFSNPAAFYARFDHGWSGELQAGSLFNDAANDWQGDHDMSCGDPNVGSRTIHIGGSGTQTGAQNPAAAESAFYPCLPGGDPAKGHVMTSINTEGYVIGWFSPKQWFTGVHRVCWDQNETFLGGGKWTQVAFATQADVQRSGGLLGFTDPDFNQGGPGTDEGNVDSGVADSSGDIRAWANYQFTGGAVNGSQVSDKAARYQRCVVDNENGTLTVTLAGPTAVTQTIAGSIPNGPIRVVFEDDNYNPDKHFTADQSNPRDSSGLYTWHWDNIQIS